MAIGVFCSPLVTDKRGVDLSFTMMIDEEKARTRNIGKGSCDAYQSFWPSACLHWVPDI